MAQSLIEAEGAMARRERHGEVHLRAHVIGYDVGGQARKLVRAVGDEDANRHARKPGAGDAAR
jgi:hypothetical protein